MLIYFAPQGLFYLFVEEPYQQPWSDEDISIPKSEHNEAREVEMQVAFSVIIMPFTIATWSAETVRATKDRFGFCDGIYQGEIGLLQVIRLLPPCVILNSILRTAVVGQGTKEDQQRKEKEQVFFHTAILLIRGVLVSTCTTTGFLAVRLSGAEYMISIMSWSIMPRKARAPVFIFKARRAMFLALQGRNEGLYYPVGAVLDTAW